MAPIEEKLRFLVSIGGAQLGHTEGNLLQHLSNTYELLKSWGARQSVCDAGLFHSIYGTEVYGSVSLALSMRGRLQEIIGEEAETLVFFFGVMEKESFYENLFRPGSDPNIASRFTGESHTLTTEQFADLCNVVVANSLEQRPRVSVKYHNRRRKEFEAIRKFLLPMAVAQVNSTYGFSSY
jgi:hypothetical protein